VSNTVEKRDDAVGEEGRVVTDRLRKRRFMGLVHKTQNVEMEKCVCHVRIHHPTRGRTLSCSSENSETMRLEKKEDR